MVLDEFVMKNTEEKDPLDNSPHSDELGDGPDDLSILRFIKIPIIKNIATLAFVCLLLLSIFDRLLDNSRKHISEDISKDIIEIQKNIDDVKDNVEIVQENVSEVQKVVINNSRDIAVVKNEIKSLRRDIDRIENQAGIDNQTEKFQNSSGERSAIDPTRKNSI